MQDVEQADALMQACPMRAIAGLDTWHAGTRLRAGLFVISKVPISEARRRCRAAAATALNDDHPGLALAGSQEARLTMIELRRVLEALPEEHGEISRLVAVQGLKYEAAAAVLGVPVKTVRSRPSCARTALRVLLEGEVVGEGQKRAGKVEAKGAA